MIAGERVVVVTGGSRGLGAGIVQSYLDSGDRVATCARSRTPLIDKWESDPTLAGRFMFAPADLSKPADARAFVDQVDAVFGPAQVLVNNAGVARDGVLPLAQDDDIDTVVDLNLKGTIYMTRLVTRRMLAHGGGHIVNISSIVGRRGYRGLSVYSATKAAMDGFTRALAREFGSRGIVVNGIAPGYLETDMSSQLGTSQLDQIIRRTPAGRLGTPDDIARVAQFLTSPSGSYLTGQIIVVDGGLTC